LQRDRKRGNYDMKEAKMASALLKACYVDKNTPAGRSVIKWNDPSTKNHGQFSKVMQEVGFIHHPVTIGRMILHQKGYFYPPYHEPRLN
jgi:hypothetical protein